MAELFHVQAGIYFLVTYNFKLIVLSLGIACNIGNLLRVAICTERLLEDIQCVMFLYHSRSNDPKSRMS